LSSEETFGPIAPLQRIADEAEALELMRRAEYGLATAVFTRDLARGLRFAERAPAGTVMINEASIYLETGFPFGGAPGSSSGIGRAHGAVAMEQVFTDLKTVVVDLGRRL